MKKTAEKVISALLSFVMIMGLTAISFAEENRIEFNDIKGHWAQAEMQILIANGTLGGYKDHTIRPNGKITRAEAIKIINKSLKLEGVSDLSIIKYSDVKKDAWYANEVAIAVKNGYINNIIKGNLLKPNELIKREEMGVMVVSALKLDIAGAGETEMFTDKDKISAEYKNLIEIAVKLGFFGGYPDGSIRPQATITRAEFTVVINRVSEYKKLNQKITNPDPIVKPDVIPDGGGGSSGGSSIGNLVIDRSGIYGGEYRDVLVASSVGDGSVTLENVIVRGNLEIQGGGSNSILLKGTTIIYGSVIINKSIAGQAPRLCIANGASVSNLEVKSDAILESMSKDAVFTNITISAKSEVKIQGNKTKVEKVELNANDVKLIGDGKVDIVNVNGENLTIEAGNEVRVNIGKDISGTIVYGKDIEKDKHVLVDRSGDVQEVEKPGVKVTVKGKGIIKVADIQPGDKIGNSEVKSKESDNKITLEYDKKKAVGTIGKIRAIEERSGKPMDVKFRVKSIKVDNVELSKENINKLMKKASGSDFVGEYVDQIDLRMISTPMSHILLLGNTITVTIENESEMATEYTVVL